MNMFAVISRLIGSLLAAFLLRAFGAHEYRLQFHGICLRFQYIGQVDRIVLRIRSFSQIERKEGEESQPLVNHQLRGKKSLA